MAARSLDDVVDPTAGDDAREEFGMDIMEDGVQDTARHVIGAPNACNNGSLRDDAETDTTVGRGATKDAGGEVDEDLEDQGVGREVTGHGVAQDGRRAEGIIEPHPYPSSIQNL